MKSRYLTKSRFQSAMECPTKLYYDGKAEYANQSMDDPFLQALADGGFQVGELAKCYFPGGHAVTAIDYETSLKETAELLQQEKVVIYEAAIRFENLFVRVDILRKNGKHIELIEVKAKSFDKNSEVFTNKNGDIDSKWQPYLYDVAFQKHVLMHALPDYKINAFLMLADKTAKCPTDGLNQKFKLVADANGRRRVEVAEDLSDRELSEKILVAVNVDEYCAQIYGDHEALNVAATSFSGYVDELVKALQQDEKIISPVTKNCKECQYKASEQEMVSGMKSGFHECWKEQLNWSEAEFKEPTVLDIWNFRKKDQLLAQGRVLLSQVSEEDINPKPAKAPGISPSERQWLQVQKAQSNDADYWLDAAGLRHEMQSWTYPLHFIDFETSMVAIPFNKGRRPYEGIAFQFSHHIVDENGRVEHKGQYLNVEPGKFPNFEFIRQLKKELEQDQGTIFRYSTHENTFLNIIHEQLLAAEAEVPDQEELCTFIRSITQSTGKSSMKWEGSRNMIDLCELVKRHFYSPLTSGSNSIKYVLPAMLNHSKFLQDKYARPIYGAADGITSLNYNDWTWIKSEDGKVIDPYKLLPKMFSDVSEHDAELLMSGEDAEIKNGGAALTAYARMQFEEMSSYEREAIKKALLKYCELDTLAMVMLYEGWQAMLAVD